MFFYLYRRSLSLALPVLLGFLLVARPAYSIPMTVKEGQQWIGEICSDFGIAFCSYIPEEDKADAKRPLRLTATERQVLTRLAEQQQVLEKRGRALDRRETQMQALQEDVQRQIVQLERVQQDIEQSIETKKAQDIEQLEKAVSFYTRMDPGAAALSITNLDQKTAVNILMRMKDKQASAVLESMTAERSSDLIDAIARKR
jgi:flagellar motility protein MotE (MotC chaperone)